MKNKTFYFISLGCNRNLVDSEIMIAILQKEDLLFSENIENADFIIVNSCSFIKDAREEGCFVLEEVFSKKKKEAKVIVCGCITEKFQNKIKEKFPDVFSFLGPGNVEEIKEVVFSKKKKSIITKKSYLRKEGIPRFLTCKNFSYLKIAEGCLKNCTYCLIPKIKGKLISKPIDLVIKEVKEVLEKGVFEIILTAQDIGDYGKDLKEKNYLEKLLKEILKIKRKFWIRLLYLSCENISNELIHVIKSDERICNYLDIPFQHVNDKILKKMRRNISKKRIISTIENIRRNIKDISIRSTFMVGFPGEKEKEFSELLDFIKTYEIDQLGVFPFSREKDTLAYDMKNQVPEKEKRRRVKEAYLEQKKVLNKIFIKKNLNKRYEVILDGFLPESNLIIKARSYRQAPEIDNFILINDISKITSFDKRYLVEIKKRVGYDFMAEVLKEAT